MRNMLILPCQSCAKKSGIKMHYPHQANTLHLTKIDRRLRFALSIFFWGLSFFQPLTALAQGNSSGNSGCGITMSCPGTGTGTGVDSCTPGGSGDTCGSNSGPASQPAANGQDVGAGNPINILSGNKYQQETDLPALPGVLGLEIVRHYNSQHALPGISATMMGHGWRLSYDTRLHVIGRTLQIMQADGTRIIFNRHRDDPSRCSTNDASRGQLRIDRQANGEKYVWVWPNGRQLFFGTQGRLDQILAPTGEFVTLTRDPKGRLIKVTDPQGRSLILNHASHRGDEGFRGLVSIDSPVGRFTYTYGSPRPDSAVFDPAEIKANLVQVRYPASSGVDPKAGSRTITREYHYEDVHRLSLLTGITVNGTGSDGQAMRQRVSTYAYDTQGNGIRSIPGPAAADGQMAAGEIRLDRSQPGKTILTNSLGQKTTYLTEVIDGEYRLLESRGPGCARCGPTNLRYRYDARGQLTATTTIDLEGRPLVSSQIQLDALKRPLRVVNYRFVQGKPVEQGWLRYEYAGDSREPQLIARPSVVAGQEHRLRINWNAAGQPLRIEESGHAPSVAGASPTQALQRVTTYRYQMVNGRSVLTQIDGPLPNGPEASSVDSDITTLAWDQQGNFLKAMTTPGGLRSDVTHDAATGMVERVVNDAGIATRFVFNPQLQTALVSTQGPGWVHSQVQSFQYNALGQQVQSFQGGTENSARQDPDWTTARPVERQEFDAQGRLLWRASALGMLQTYQYNHEGQPVQERLRSAHMVKALDLSYDEWGRITDVADNAGRRRHLRYGADRQLAAVTDALGRETEARPMQPLRGAAPGKLHTWQLRDDFGRSVLTGSPDSGRTLRSFDAADRLVAMTDAQGNTAAYAYDVQGRILSQTITEADSRAVLLTQWRYSARHLIEVSHPTQHERFEYDARGLRSARIVTLQTPAGAHTSVTRYEHDDQGQLSATTLPDGSRLFYQRNGQGQVVALSRQTIQTSWLRWLGKDQPIAQDFARDLVGLARYTSGNGIQALYQRSAQGTLARVVYRHSTPRTTLQAGHDAPTLRMSRQTQETIERLLGVRVAQAQGAASAAAMPAGEHKGTRPGGLGALDLPHDPQALVDHRYLWSAEGHLLLNQQRAGSPREQSQFSHAYDAQDRLVASVQASQAKPEANMTPVGGADPRGEVKEQAVWRYAYDAHQRRVLSQQGAVEQADAATGTLRSQFHDGSHRLDHGAAPTTYNANGQPERVGSREYVWDALGRLVEVRQDAKPLAQYRYDHRGLRHSKTVLAVTTHTLYDESRQPLAELDAQGRITRQYIFLADMPLAVIDSRQGRPLAAEQPGVAQILADLGQVVQSWLHRDDGMVWLHTNHLGAPEAATNAQGHIVWRASYAPFGAAQIRSASGSSGEAWVLNLRLPGQMFDAETGLYYNRQRYYDPEQGQYLTPDPLGTPDGPNPYAYVAFNPLANVDPDGLILFAFDGTGNSNDLADPAMDGGSLSNVWEFRDRYQDGARRYITGVGTVHRDSEYGNIVPDDFANGTLLDYLTGSDPLYLNDMGGNYSGPERIERMMLYLRDEAEIFDDKNAMDIDIVGFSRGAAQARDFANRITRASTIVNGNTYYKYKNKNNQETCQRVNFRFMGLWDTVLSTNFSGTSYNLSIPAQFAYVAQAVALNEHRSSNIFSYSQRAPLPHSQHWGGFPLESIGASNSAVGAMRIELGFLGAHADIGGGFADNGLSKVALAWMVDQAKAAGVQMDTSPITIASTVVLHDKSNNIQTGKPEETCALCTGGEDRKVNGAVGGSTQRTMGFGTDRSSMTYVDTQQHEFIAYTDRSKLPRYTNGEFEGELHTDQTGTVNMNAYVAWLKLNGYSLDSLKVQ